MQQLFQSDFLQALGRAILDSIWQMAILFLVFQLIVFAFRIKEARIKNFFSSMLALGGLLWFLLTFLFKAGTVTQKLSVVIHDSSNPVLLNAFAKDNQWQLLINWFDYKLHFILPYLSFAYIIFLSWFLFKFSIQLKAVQTLRKKGLLPVDEELNSFFRLLALAMGIDKQVQICISTEVDIPSAVGFLKPLVLLPAAAVNHLTPAQLEAVLLHELAHIKRNDYFWNMLLTVTETVLFFNPFAQLLIAIARRERENSCDDQVMNYQKNAAVYAEALLNVEKVRLLQPQLVMGLGDSKYHLMDRVKRILNVPAEKNRISSRILALILVTLIFTLTGWVISHKQQTKTGSALSVKETIPLTAGTLFLSPDATVVKKNQLLALRDEKRKLNIEVKPGNTHNNEYYIWNDTEGKELKVDKIILNDLPDELLEHWNEKTRLVAPPPPPDFIEEHTTGRRNDSLHKRFSVQWRQEVIQQEMQKFRNRSKNQTGFFFNNELMQVMPPKWEIDSLVKVYGDFWPKGMNWKEYFESNHFSNESAIEEAHREQFLQDRERAGLIQKRKLLTTKFKAQDSVRKRIHEKFRTAPLAALEKMKGFDFAEGGITNESVIEIVINDGLAFINGKPVTLTTQSDSIQPKQPPVLPRRLKRMEVIRL